MRLSLVAALAMAACTVTGPQQCPSLQRPSARSQVGAVLVPATNQIYALGGAGPQLPLDELWRYSFGACGGWTRLTLASSPGARADYAAALDTMRNRIVYIGGGPTNDVWALDTDRLTFTKLAAVGTPPIVAASEVAAYDAMHDRILYAGIETYALEFGGSEQGQWVFLDGTSLQSPASGAFDPTRSLLVVYDQNGLHGLSSLTSTWHDILLIGNDSLPPADPELVWYDGGQQLIAVGSNGITGYFALDANGSSAQFYGFATTNAPTPRTRFAVAVSGTTLWLSGGVTASGCTLDDLWTLDLATLAWTNVWPATVCL